MVSPLLYQQALRLHEAGGCRCLTMDAGEACVRVGYVSASFQKGIRALLRECANQGSPWAGARVRDDVARLREQGFAAAEARADPFARPTS